MPPTVSRGRGRSHVAHYCTEHEIPPNKEKQCTTDGFRTSSSIPVTFADYGVDTPNIGAITVEDEGNIEFLIAFAPT